MPFTKRLCYSLISISLLGMLLYVGKEILVPFFLAAMLASLLLPFNRFLERKRFPRVLAISFSMTFSLLMIGSIIYLLANQLSNFMDDLPMMQERLSSLSHEAQKWFRSNFGMTIREQNRYLTESATQMKESQGGVLQQTYGTLTDAFSYLVLVPMYGALILYYRDMIRRFLVDAFSHAERGHVTDILRAAQSVSQKFIAGLMIQMSIVFLLNAAGFLILGIKYAIFLALFAAILNLIPYIGMIVANVFSMLITLIASEVMQVRDVVWVGVILAAVQFVDNNLLMTLVVGSKVRINALVTIFGVLLGGALCGITGMFLSIPGLAVLKVIFDRVDALKPYGMLLGDDRMTGKEMAKGQTVLP